MVRFKTQLLGPISVKVFDFALENLDSMRQWTVTIACIVALYLELRVRVPRPPSLVPGLFVGRR